MSPWSHEELQVLLHPSQVTLRSVRRTLSWRGLRHTIGQPCSVCCDSANAHASGTQPWHAALQALEAALPGRADDKTAATVVLSNQLVRYAVLPWRAELADAQEHLSLARHGFSRMYGKAALQWDLRLSHQAPTLPRLACAIDAPLPEALRAVFNGAQVPLHSIQPHLMAAFNQIRGRLRHANAWLALLEPGNLCLVLLRHGHWSRVRNVRIGPLWRVELPLILDREAFLADDPAIPHEVYVWPMDTADTAVPDAEPWQFHVVAHHLVPAAGSTPHWPAAAAMAR